MALFCRFEVLSSDLKVLLKLYCNTVVMVMVSAVDSWLRGLGSRPDWPGHCVQFLSMKNFPSQYPSPLRSIKYKWVKVNCLSGLAECRGVACDELASHQEECEYF